MNPNEEMIEEIEEIETPEENKIEQEVDVEIAQEPLLSDDNITLEENVAEDNIEDISNEIIEEEKKEEAEKTDEVINEETKKNKTPLIVILSILLALDIAALVIYLIGIDKVISFIK